MSSVQTQFPKSATHSFMERDHNWMAVFAIYFALHTVFRLLLGSSLGIDEAEMMVAGQKLSWGYGPQLPLYAWMQWITFQVFGENLLGISILKYTLLFSTTAILYAFLRQSVQPRIAGLATLFLLTLPQFSWEAQHDLTHSLLAAFASVLTLLGLFRMARHANFLNSLILGLAISIGLLSKYNYAFVFVASLAAMLIDPQLRRAFSSRWMALSALMPIAIVFKPFLWVLENQEAVLSKAHKFKIMQGGQAHYAFMKGISSLLMSCAGYILPPLSLAFILWWFYREEKARIQIDRLNNFTLRVMFIATIIVCASVIFSGSTEVKDRWMLPILFFMAPSIALIALPNINPLGFRRLIQVATGLVILIAIMLVPYSFLGRAYRSAPFAEITPKIMDQIPKDASMLATTWIAGNLLNADPRASVFEIESGIPNIQNLYLVWNENLDPPIGILSETKKIFEAPYPYHKDKILRIAIAKVSK